MRAEIPQFLINKHEGEIIESPSRRVRSSIVGKGIGHAASMLRTGFIQWETASRRGFFQGLDARIKVLFLILFVVIVSLKTTLLSQGAIAILLLGLAVASRLDLFEHYRKIFAFTFLFGFLLAAPSAFNIITPGEIVGPVLPFRSRILIGSFVIPPEIGITGEGLRRVAMLSLRVMNSLSISLLVVATTPFDQIMKALRTFRVPDIFLMTITLSYKYIFIFVTIVHEMHMARKSRLVAPQRDREARRWVAGRIAFMYQKSQQRCEEVFRAMTARGLSDSIRLHRMPPLTSRDWLSAAGLLLCGAALLWGI